jgi:hypothetical protein
VSLICVQWDNAVLKLVLNLYIGSVCVRVWNLMFVTSRDLSFMFMFGLVALQGV